MTLQEKIDKLIKEYNETSSPKRKRDLYKAIRRCEARRRRQKLEKEGIVC